MRKWGPAATVAVFALWACPSSTPTPAALHRAVSVGTPAPSVDAGVLISAAGFAAAPQTCPSSAPVFCDGGCCATGLSCNDAGGCAETTGAAACPSDLPVSCSTAASCAGGCVALDSSGNRRNFFLNAPAGFVPGRYGTGVSTSQRTGCAGPWMTMDAGGLPAGNSPMTLELWLRSDGGVGQTVIYAQGDPAAGRSLIQDQFGQIYWGSQLAGVVIDGAWHFIAATWDGTQGAIYLDGRVHTSRAAPAIATPADAGIVLGGNCNPFPGDIDELRILDYAADGGQIAGDYDAGHLAPGAGVVGLWHFDEGSAQTCCPAGTTCSAAGCSASSVAPTALPCGDGGFCDSTLVCTQLGCAHPDGGLTCPPGEPVDCGNGNCCPSGDFCTNGVCRRDDAGVPTNTCPTYAPTAFELSGSLMACCQTFSYPMTAFTAVNVSCTGGATLNGAVCEFGGTAVGCGNGGCNAGPDMCCTDPSGAFQTCMESATTTFTCAASHAACSGDATHPGGCCPIGLVCAGPGSCCPGGETACGAGCCPAGQCVSGSCVAPPAPKTCPYACPPGSVCTAGYCVAGPPSPTVCGNGTPCGSECCPNGESCVNGGCVHATVSITCPDNLPSQCGPAGPCCRAGFTCFGNAGPGPSGFYCVGQFPAAHGGPQGVVCGAGDYCDTGLQCGGGGVCCPGGETQVCGGQCCTADETCVNGQCGCPAGQTTCGTACCPQGSVCKNGACAPACAGGDACGGFCCAAGSTCSNGECSCPGDHPVPCGGACCLAGASCFNSVDCNCPPGRAACGFDCCAAGDVCTGGVCGAPGSSGGGGFDGTYSGSCTVTGQLGSGTSPALLTFANGVLTSGLPGGSGSISASGVMTLLFRDSCNVSFPVSGQASTSGSFTLSGGNTNDLNCAVQNDTCTLHKQ